jgi:hypothetical protein
MYIIRETILRVFNLDGSFYWFYSVAAGMAVLSRMATCKHTLLHSQSPPNNPTLSLSNREEQVNQRMSCVNPG